MKELTQTQVQDVNGGILFMVVPLGYAMLAVGTELAVIAAIAANSID